MSKLQKRMLLLLPCGFVLLFPVNIISCQWCPWHRLRNFDGFKNSSGFLTNLKKKILVKKIVEGKKICKKRCHYKFGNLHLGMIVHPPVTQPPGAGGMKVRGAWADSQPCRLLEVILSATNKTTSPHEEAEGLSGQTAEHGMNLEREAVWRNKVLDTAGVIM